MPSTESDPKPSEPIGLHEQLLFLLERQVEHAIERTEAAVRAMFERLQKIEAAAADVRKRSHSWRTDGGPAANAMAPVLADLQKEIEQASEARREGRKRTLLTLQHDVIRIRSLVDSLGPNVDEGLRKAFDRGCVRIEGETGGLIEDCEVKPEGTRTPEVLRSLARKILAEAAVGDDLAQACNHLMAQAQEALGHVLAELQFQDSVRQQLEATISIAKAAVSGGPDFDPAELRRSYTMEAQRRIHDEVFGPPADRTEDDASGPPIQLF